jgi:hypothetical protein
VCFKQVCEQKNRFFLGKKQKIHYKTVSYSTSKLEILMYDLMQIINPKFFTLERWIMSLDFITVVSGLPRSGTSMMMQALEAGGMPVLTDHIRKSDEDNPKGYYEFEPVKKTKTDSSWVPEAVGKVVKMVYRLLYDLPEGYEYRVVFMRRNIEEILLSQNIMLERSGQNSNDVSTEKLAEMFKRDLEKIESWISNQGNFSIISVDYKEMIESPIAQSQRVNGFLGGELDIEKMSLVVDPSLYRNRK